MDLTFICCYAAEILFQIYLFDFAALLSLLMIFQLRCRYVQTDFEHILIIFACVSLLYVFLMSIVRFTSSQFNTVCFAIVYVKPHFTISLLSVFSSLSFRSILR